MVRVRERVWVRLKLSFSRVGAARRPTTLEVEEDKKKYLSGVDYGFPWDTNAGLSGRRS